MTKLLKNIYPNENRMPKHTLDEGIKLIRQMSRSELNRTDTNFFNRTVTHFKMGIIGINDLREGKYQ